MAGPTTSGDACAQCARAIGVANGFAPYNDVCAPCSGKPVKQCAGCEVTFVDIGIPGCPFCRHWRARSL